MQYKYYIDLWEYNQFINIAGTHKLTHAKLILDTILSMKYNSKWYITVHGVYKLLGEDHDIARIRQTNTRSGKIVYRWQK